MKSVFFCVFRKNGISIISDFMKYVFIKKGDNLIFAFVIPFVLHGCYNLFASSNFTISLILILIAWIVALRMFSRLKKTQKTKRREYEKKL